MVPIGDVFDIQQGKALSAAARGASDRYPFLRTTNVLWNRIDGSSIDTMGLSAQERSRLALCPGDLLVCEGGEIGRAAVWHGEIDECFYQNHIHRLRSRREASPEFFAFWFKYAFTMADLYQGAGTKTTIANLSMGRLAALPIPLPPLDEQLRIAAALTTIQRAQNAVNSEIRQLEVLKESYKAGFLSAYSKTSQVALGSLRCSINTGPFGSQLHASDYVPVGVRVLNPMHLLRNGVVDGPTPCVNEHTATRLERHKLRVGDVIIPRRGELSRYARVDANIAGSLCGTGCMVIRLEDQRINADYFATYFGSEGAQAYLRDAATGTIMPNINPKILESMPIPLPSRAKQDEFVKGCDAIDSALRAADNKTKVLSRVFDSALSCLFGPQL